MTATNLLTFANNIGSRSESFLFELVDASLNHRGYLSPSTQSVPQLQVDTSRTTVRTLTNLVLPAGNPDIDVFNDRLRVYYVLQTGDRYPLGVFLFGERVESQLSGGNVQTFAAMDENSALDTKLDRTYSLRKSDKVIGLFTRFALTAFPLTRLDINVADVAAGSPVSFAVGSSRYQAMVALAQLLQCYPPFVSNSGFLTLKQVVAVGDTTVDHTYNIGGIIRSDPAPAVTDDSYQAPNVYQVLGDGTTPVVGTYQLPSNAPQSVANRGYPVVDSRTVHGLHASNANVVARNVALRDRQTFRKATFSSMIDPRHDTNDIVSFLGDRYLETVWTMELRAGGVMTHNLVRIWD